MALTLRIAIIHVRNVYLERRDVFFNMLTKDEPVGRLKPAHTDKDHGT
jgi:hypothetical protein